MKESQLTVRTDMLWLSKRTKQSSGIYLEKCPCLFAVSQKRGGLSIVESVEAEDILYSNQPQGGLEIPCEVIFTAKAGEIKKLKRSLKS